MHKFVSLLISLLVGLTVASSNFNADAQLKQVGSKKQPPYTVTGKI